MKLASVLLLVLAQATALQTACASRSTGRYAQSPPANSIVQSQDKELLQNVEQFAGEGYESSSAWQNLMSHDRQKLIDELSRISDALPGDDRKRVLIAFTFCKMRVDYDHNRQVILGALSKPSPYKDLYGDWVVTMLGSLLRDGDKALLEPLFKASAWSDGAMSTDLASVYSDALQTDPDGFVNVLSVQSQTTWDDVTHLLRDNSLTVEQKQKLRRYLRTVTPSSRLAPVVEQTLRALSN